MTKNICMTVLLLAGVPYLKLSLYGNWKYIKPVEGQNEDLCFQSYFKFRKASQELRTVSGSST